MPTRESSQGHSHDRGRRTADVRLRWLRPKVGSDPLDPVWLLTVRDVG